MTKAEAIQLDVSELESPLPLQKILSTIQANTENRMIIVTHRINPLGLYPYLDKLGLLYSCQKDTEQFVIKIWKRS